MADPICLFAVGDVAPRRDDPAAMLAAVEGLKGPADLLFGQLECPLSDRGSPLPQARLAMRTDPGLARALRDAGFDAVSFAGNHCLDWGPDAFADTLEHVRAVGLALCGAGPDIAAARRPAIFERGGRRFAFLAYSSILPQGYWAEAGRAGCAPLRAHTLQAAPEHAPPGSSPAPLTFCHRADLAALRDDVRAARTRADHVIVSVHWGIHFVAAQIADYQREAAYAAIDAGADAVIGHHPHVLKGVELHRGRPIFYSLGNFAIDQPQAFEAELTSTRSFREIAALNPGFDAARRYILPPDSQRSMIARLAFGADGEVRAAFLPVMIDDDCLPARLAPQDPRFAEIATYVEAIGRTEGLANRYERAGGEVRLA
ncbi:CapA family protein [Phenylobacterium soli]|uniref:CapA family protein n=1 Tax=Phenylobacterium soli TaxID=2170551 RepID=A0A328AEJ4_9CAUL|nr:CapA family protein [Phenylobacterium soli]RAK51794.1 CapA family protein [Phenylobacterium soli]